MEREGGDDVPSGGGMEKLVVGGFVAGAHGGRHPSRRLDTLQSSGQTVQTRAEVDDCWR